MTNKILALTKKLISLESTKDNAKACKKVLDIAKQELKDFYIEEFESNGIKSILVNNIKPGKKKFKILLHAHLDVVEANKKQFTPYEKDGKLYGRGAYDMKAAASTMIVLFKNIAKNLNFPLALQLVTDEEINGYNGARYQISKGVRADFIITGECSTNLEIVNQAKGIAFIELQAKGVSAHGAHLWHGNNALWKLHNALTSLHKIFPVPDSETWTTTVNLAKIETKNTTITNVPDNATAYLDIRFIPKDEKHLVKKMSKVASPHAQIGVTLFDAPVYTSPENKYVKLLQKNITQITKKELGLKSAHGTSDMRHFSAIGCPGVEFGVIGANQNADNEWVDIKSIGQYYDILEQFLLSVK